MSIACISDNQSGSFKIDSGKYVSLGSPILLIAWEIRIFTQIEKFNKQEYVIKNPSLLSFYNDSIAYREVKTKKSQAKSQILLPLSDNSEILVQSDSGEILLHAKLINEIWIAESLYDLRNS